MVIQPAPPGPAPADSVAPALGLPPNPATMGVIHACGESSTPLLTVATFGVTLAMGTAVALVLTRRPDVLRFAGLSNLVLGSAALLYGARAGGACVPVAAMAASLPLLIGVASLVASRVWERRGRKNGRGSEADSG